MKAINVRELRPGEFSLWLEADMNDVNAVIAELGHLPNGYFWDGVVDRIVAHEAPHLAGRFKPDPEAGAYSAYGTDRAALEDLAVRLTAAASDEARVRHLLALPQPGTA